MKDFLGNELAIGDNVIAAISHGRNSGATLVKFTITGFTNKFVTGTIPDYTGYTGRFSQKKISPEKIVKMDSLSSG